MRTGLLPELQELRSMADTVIDTVRNGEHIDPGCCYIHRQLVDDMGGTPAWEALKADLNTAQEEFRW